MGGTALPQQSLWENFQFMYSRPWHEVLDFYSNVVNGHISFLELFRTQTVSSSDHFVHGDAKIQEASSKSELEHVSNEDRPGRWAKVTFKIVLSYHGGSFDGWQKQPGMNTVQGLVEKSLGRFVDEKKAQQLRDKCKPLEACAVVAGRTDKGVSAHQQVCSFYTWRKDVTPDEIKDVINSSAPGKLRVISVSEVSRAFHPNFSAKWRRYLYIFPLNDGEDREQSLDSEDLEYFSPDDKYNVKRQECYDVTSEEYADESVLSGDDGLESVKKPRGPPTECFIYHARAMEARLPCSMVRVLVATSIREAAAGAEDDALLKLMDASCRRASAPPAPPEGLCLVDVGYIQFDQQICFSYKYYLIN